MVLCGLAFGACTGRALDASSSPPNDLAWVAQPEVDMALRVDMARGVDLSTPVDLAVESVDLAFRPGHGCKKMVACYIDCLALPLTQVSACTSACSIQASSAAYDRYSTARSCGEAWCVSMGSTSPNAPAYRCMRSPDQSRLLNVDGTTIQPSDPGTGTRACGRCLNDALLRLYGTTCSSMSSADCNPMVCADENDACFDDLI